MEQVGRRWTRIFSKPGVAFVTAALRYAQAVPTRIDDARRYYAGIYRGVLATIGAPSGFRTPGRFVQGDTLVHLWFRSFTGLVRPRTDDVSHLVLSNEIAVSRWFTPSRGDVVVDVGANVGGYTLRAAAAGCTVIAIEANPETAKVLESSVEANGFDRVRVLPFAVGPRGGQTDLYVPSDHLGQASVIHHRSATRVRVPVITLDAAISSCGVDRIDWLKIDVEGFEVEVLRGAEEALSFVRKMVIEVEDANVAECYRLLVDRLGFKIVDCVPGTEYTYWFLQGKRP